MWAVGYYYDTNISRYRTLTLHWNGTQWLHVSSPNLEFSTQLYGVVAVSPGDAWAVSNIIIHWNGTTWETSYVLGGPPSRLFGIGAVSANDIWAVGEYSMTSEGGETLIMRYTGQCTSPTPTVTGTPPTATPTLTSTPTATVPTIQPSATATPKIISSNTPVTPTSTIVFPTDTPVDATGTPIPATNTVVLPTNTQVAPTGTVSAVTTTGTPAVATSTPAGATATTTPCTVSYTDVPPGHTFYPYVRCLACKGIIGGYSDGTFRPNNAITRAQLSKIVANSAGFNEPVSGQTFEDVEPDNTFYLYIGRMASRGILGGYPCGGTGEPCGTTNRPYFRPNANATRGQISKIVSEAANIRDIPEGQTYQDVPPENTFYVWIERLTSRGVMSGYPCGTMPSEPCGTSGKPYFRPNNNATRGQVTKIVSGAFFPNCDTEQ